MTKSIHNIRQGFGAIFDPKQPDLGPRVAAFYESYFDRHHHELRWCLFGSPSHYQPIADKQRARVRHTLTKRPKKPFLFRLHDSKSADAGTSGTPQRQLDCFLFGDEPDRDDPWEWLTLVQPEDDDHQLLLQELLELARTVALHYAVGGYYIGGFLPDRERAYRTCLKYPGLEFWEVSLPHGMKRVRTTNWLTLVTHASLAPLGGIDKLRARFSSAIVIHDVLDGVVFQAGPEPTLGEVGRPDELGPYREVAQALKPIRDLPDEYYPGTPGRFSLDEEKLWLARFDKDPPQYKLPPGYEPPKPESEKKFLARLAKVQAEIGPPLVDPFLAMVEAGERDVELFAKLERDLCVHKDIGIAAHGISVVLFKKQLRLWRAAAAKDPGFQQRWQAARIKHPELAGT